MSQDFSPEWLEWCAEHQASIRFHKASDGAQRVIVTIPGGISHEAATFEAAVRACETLRQRRVGPAKVLRVARPMSKGTQLSDK